MDTACTTILRRNSFPLEPRPTGLQPVLARLPAIKAVLFDVYGTLFISAARNTDALARSGIVAAAAFSEAIAAAGLSGGVSGQDGAERLAATIHRSHEASRRRGVEYPEVDILTIWRTVLESLMRDGLLEPASLEQKLLQRVAVEYEWRTNPVWPMPQAEWCLRFLGSCGVAVGLVSNAQFFTPALFPALFGALPEELGIDPDLQFYSYRYGHAKPGIHLHSAARRVLARRKIRPAETLYVGNDMLSDVVPAARAGFHTALFGGDERSLRWPYCAGWADVAPELVLTDLGQLPPCVVSFTRAPVVLPHAGSASCAGRNGSLLYG
ncbi:MAG: HAD family hydrolase [Pirellulales bacterium]